MMNFILVQDGMLNLDHITFINKEENYILLSNGKIITLMKDDMDTVYSLTKKITAQERAAELLNKIIPENNEDATT